MRSQVCHRNNSVARDFLFVGLGSARVRVVDTLIIASRECLTGYALSLLIVALYIPVDYAVGGVTSVCLHNIEMKPFTFLLAP